MGSVLMDSKYILNEEEYSYWENNQTESISLKFNNNFARVVSGHQNTLTSSNLVLLGGLVLSGMVKEWESRILAGKYNMYGALRLDREVRACLSGVQLGSWGSSDSEHGWNRGSIRDYFSRLTETCLVIGVEQVDEVLEVWGPRSGLIRWRLNASEVRKVLACRVEFSQSQISDLVL